MSATQLTGSAPYPGAGYDQGGTSFGKNFFNGQLNSSSFSWQGAASAGYGMLMNAIPTPHSDLNSSNQDSANIRSGISQALISSGNPYAMAAGAAYGIIDKTGGFNDASEGLSGGKDMINKAGSILLPGAGYFLSSTDKYKQSDSSKQMNGGYLGFQSFVDTKVTPNAGGKFLVGNSEVNANVAKAKQQDYDISRIKDARDDDFMSMYSMSTNIGVGNQFALNGGYSSTYAVAAKKGIKITNGLTWVKSFNIGGKTSGLKFSQFNKVLSNFKLPELEPQTIKVIHDDQQPQQSQEEGDDLAITIQPPTNPSVTIEAPTQMPQQEENNSELDALDNWLSNFEQDDLGVYQIPQDVYDKLTEEQKIQLEKSGIHFTVVPTKLTVNVEKHKAGGTFNVIPEGALHKNKHHMEDAEGLTKKGIPVVTEENGELVQQAEIEKEEIIFNLAVTETLEKLMKKAKDSESESDRDACAIAAGKLITKEILHNTKDMTGLIKEC